MGDKLDNVNAYIASLGFGTDFLDEPVLYRTETAALPGLMLSRKNAFETTFSYKFVFQRSDACLHCEKCAPILSSALHLSYRNLPHLAAVRARVRGWL